MKMEDSANISISVSIHSREYLSISHIASAGYFSREAYTLEQNSDTKYRLQHKSYVIGAVLLTVAFLEATINEIFTDASDNLHQNIKDLSPNAINLMGKMWEYNVPRTASFPILISMG